MGKRSDLGFVSNPTNEAAQRAADRTLRDWLGPMTPEQREQAYSRFRRGLVTFYRRRADKTRLDHHARAEAIYQEMCYGVTA